MSDADFLARAAALAAPWMTFPNPRVGCVIVDANGDVVGEGAHHAAGGPHAEIHALEQAGPRSAGATAYVTLEPCRHTGRTGPCADALIASGIARVVIARRDPNPLAAGGVNVLRDAGVSVDVVASSEADAVNEQWLHAMTMGRPFVTLKMATSIDGRVAAAHGVESSISNEASRQRVHELRARVDGILVGTGTAVTDDPELTPRLVDTPHRPHRFVMGERDLPPHLALFRDHSATQLATHDPAAALAALHERQVRHLLIEGGPRIARAFIDHDLVDELVWITAPVVLGEGPLALGDTALEQTRRYRPVSVTDVDGDLWTVMRP